MNLTDRERLFVAQAFMNAVGGMCSTKDPDSLRGRVNEEYKRLYEETGAKSFDAKLGGEKVGTMSLTVSKPTESETRHDFVLSDKKAFAEWKDYKAAALDYAASHPEEVAAWHFGNTGELPQGCEIQEYVVVGCQGGEVTRTTLKIDERKVAEVLGNGLTDAASLLLGGGVDD